MDFLKQPRRRSLISELVYIILNVGLAVTLLLVVQNIQSPLPAIGIFLLSKWRILAVRPRYWFTNLHANFVDIIVGISFVILLGAASAALGVQIALTILFIAWLLFIKPRSKRSFVAAQSAAALFFGVSALVTVSYNWDASIVVLLMWLIGYSAARHILGHYQEAHRSFFSLLWGFILAELGWLTYHWTFAYSIPGFGALKLSQAALVALTLSFLSERVYASYRRHDSVRIGEIILPTISSIAVIAIILLFFNTLDRGAL